MRFLFFSSVFPSLYRPHKGAFNFQLCEALASEHDVRIVSPVPWREYYASLVSLTEKDAPVKRNLSNATAHFPIFYYPPGLLHRWHDRFLEVSVARAMKIATKEIRPDCILSYWSFPDSYYAARYALAHDIPFIPTIGGSDLTVHSAMDWYGNRLKWMFARAPVIVAVSDSLKWAVSRLGIDESKIRVIYRGVDHDRFSADAAAAARTRLKIPTNGKVVVWVGRCHPIKRLDVLLHAAALARKARASFDLYVIGDGEDRGRMEQLSRTLQVDSFVRFVGFVGHSELADWYRAANLTVLCSDSEGVPNVLLESIACGTPFVATDVGGIREIAVDGDGVLVPPNSPQSLADAICKHITGSSRIQFRGNKWPRTWAQTARQYADLAKSLCSGN